MRGYLAQLGPLRLACEDLAAVDGNPFFCADPCLLYTSDAADERSSVDLGGRRIIKKKNHPPTSPSVSYISYYENSTS